MSHRTLVLFDAYNTLIDLGHAHEDTIAMLLKKLNATVDPGEFHKYWDWREHENLLEAAARERGPFVSQTGLNVKSLRETFEHFGIMGDAESGVELWVELSRRSRPFSDVGPALDSLRGNHTMGIVSNADNYPLMDILRRANLEFEAVVTSETVRSYKPNPRIFRYALKALGRKASETAFVGDSPVVDIPGAAAVGLLTASMPLRARMRRLRREPAAACAT